MLCGCYSVPSGLWALCLQCGLIFLKLGGIKWFLTILIQEEFTKKGTKPGGEEEVERPQLFLVMILT